MTAGERSRPAAILLTRRYRDDISIVTQIDAKINRNERRK